MHPLDRLARKLACGLDRIAVGRPDGRPHLFAVRIERDRAVALVAVRRDADVMADKLGVGEGITGSARFERGDAFVGEGLAHGESSSG
jgi:hypothetical protein